MLQFLLTSARDSSMIATVTGVQISSLLLSQGLAENNTKHRAQRTDCGIALDLLCPLDCDF